MNANTFEGKKVLVTGATGFLGSHLCKLLVEQNAHVSGTSLKGEKDALNALGVGERVTLYPLDITQQSNVHDFFKQHSFDFVFHLAAVSSTKATKEEAHETNVVGTRNVVASILSSPSTRMILSSTIRTIPIEKGIFANAGDYDQSKWEAEKIVEEARTKSDFRFGMVRLTTLYGESSSGKGYGRIIGQAIRGETLKLTAQLERERDYLYVGDAATGILAAGAALEEKRWDGKPLPLGTGTQHTLKKFLGILQESLSKKIIYQENKDEPLEVPVKYEMNTTQKILQWKPTLAFEQGLKKMVDWYILHPPKEKESK